MRSAIGSLIAVTKLVALSLIAVPLNAADVLHLHDRTIDASLVGVDSQGRLQIDREGFPSQVGESISLEQIVAWQSERDVRRRGREAIVLTDGSLIYGTLLTIRGDLVLLQHAAFGSQEFNLRDTAGIVFDADAIDVAGLLSAWSSDSLQAEDTVYTAAGDSLAGVAEIDQQGLSLLSRRAEASVKVRRGTEQTSLSISKLSAIRFSPALRPITAPGDGGWWLSFDEGSQLRARRFLSDSDRGVTCELMCGVAIVMPEAAVAETLVAIEHPSQSSQWKLLGPADLQDAKAIAPFTFRPQPRFTASWSLPLAGDALQPNRCQMRAASRLVWAAGGDWTLLSGSARLELPPDALPVASDVGGSRAPRAGSAAEVAVRLKVFAVSDAGATELWSGPPLDTPGQTLNFTIPLAASGARPHGRIVLLIDSDRRDAAQPSLSFEYLRLSRP